MLNIFAKSFMTAARNPDEQPKADTGRQTYRKPSDPRRDAEIEAHLVARRRY